MPLLYSDPHCIRVRRRDRPAVSEADLAKTILSRRVLPACGIMLFIGNFYMSWLATRMKTQYGRDFTAQPYGINTVGAYPFLFDIMLPIALGAPANGTDIGTPLETAWKAGCTGNFIVGIINVVLGCVFLIKPAADFILKWVLIASFVVPVAGVGLTRLALNQIGPNFATPVAGYVPVFLIFVMYFSSGSGSPIKIGKIGLPRPLHWVIYGAALGYAYKLTNVQGDNYQYTYPGGGAWAGGAFVQGFSQLGPYMGTIIPLAIVATMSDIMCLVGAYNAGDPCACAATQTMLVSRTPFSPRRISPFFCRARRSHLGDVDRRRPLHHDRLDPRLALRHRRLLWPPRPQAPRR